MFGTKSAVITGAQKGIGTDTDERLLVAQAKSGRSSAFGELCERYRARIYHMTLRVLRNHQDAEDAVQRSFQRAFTHLARFREDSTFSTWVTSIAINEARMLLRQRRTKQRLLEVNDDGDGFSSTFDLADSGPTPEEILVGNELRAVLIQAVSQLRRKTRTVVLLCELEGFTNAETARRVGLSAAAVKARIFHARRCLRQYLEQKYKGGRGGALVAAPR